jgi:hypothetical protein
MMVSGRFQKCFANGCGGFVVRYRTRRRARSNEDGEQCYHADGDVLEGLVADDLWPLPAYREMLFIK